MMYRVTLKKTGVLGVRSERVFAINANEAVKKAHYMLFPYAATSALEVITCEYAEWVDERDAVTYIKISEQGEIK